MSLAGKYKTKRKIDIELESSESDTHSTEKKRQRTGSPIETEQEIHKQDQEPQKTEQQASTPPLTDSRQSDSYSNENGGLLTKFIVGFQTVRNIFGYVSGLRRKLQCSTPDIVERYILIYIIKCVVKLRRDDEKKSDTVFEKDMTMAVYLRTLMVSWHQDDVGARPSDVISLSTMQKCIFDMQFFFHS
ncbi:unnamed protein product [Mytilus edulis]|uniref:Uncharacterized protein n=1 Tax=Mytilus edulis TaxID=6550 RepID=A0A8S3TXT9_MYTED|nr:unnamed protein product [Mytilus edulis]